MQHQAPLTHIISLAPVGTWGLFCLLETINVNSKSTPTYSQYKKGITGFASLDAVILLPANYLIKMELWTGANTAKKIIFIAIFITLKTLQIISVSNNMQLTERSHIDLKIELYVAIKTDGSEEH